jgi:hypothetical protein
MQFWHMNGADPTGLKVELTEPLAGLPLQRGVHVTGQVNPVPNEPMEMNVVLTTTPPSSFGNYLVMFSIAMVHRAVAEQLTAICFLREAGTTETWDWIHLTVDAHPMHLHLVSYQVLNRQVLIMQPPGTRNAKPLPQEVDQLPGPPGPDPTIPGGAH